MKSIGKVYVTANGLNVLQEKSDTRNYLEGARTAEKLHCLFQIHRHFPKNDATLGMVKTVLKLPEKDAKDS